jgi:hypothetical protein
MADEVKWQVALAMSQQQQLEAAAPEPNVAADLSQRKSSTDHPTNTVDLQLKWQLSSGM